MKKKLLFLSLLLFYQISGSFAQYGCVVVFDTHIDTYKIYTKSLGTTTVCNGFDVELFDPNVFTDFTAPCSISPNPLSLIISPNYRNCKVGGGCGIKGNYTVINCPLDSPTNIALLFGAGLCFYFFRKKVQNLWIV
jgi:hypothetical protein